MALHVPVMVAEVLAASQPEKATNLVDMTVGGAGHAQALMELAPPNARLVAIDRDQAALEMARPALAKYADRVEFVHSRYSRLPDILAEAGMDHADVVLLDAGASRDQLVDPERGFSFASDVHLDMRQSRDEPLTAHIVVNEYSLADLGAVLSRTGKAREARRIAARIAASRPINSTAQLADIIAAAVAKPYGPRGKTRNPSAEWFMAIRVEVNDEENELIGGIEAGVRALRPQSGRFVLLTWNGLEHRIARSSLRSLINPCRCPPSFPCNCGLKPLASWLAKGDSPTEAEVAQNPSARSCRLFAVTAA